MTTWDELAWVARALLLQSAALLRTTRPRPTQDRAALQREQARRLRRGLPPAGA